MEEKTPRQALADGSLLRYLKNKFSAERSEENLFPLLACLRDSTVFVPMNVTTESENGSKRYSPELLRSPDGSLYFPVFTQRETILDAFESNYEWMPVEAVECVKMAGAHHDVAGLVFDAFNEPLDMPMNVASIIGQMPSTIEMMENKHR